MSFLEKSIQQFKESNKSTNLQFCIAKYLHSTIVIQPKPFQEIEVEEKIYRYFSDETIEIINKFDNGKTSYYGTRIFNDGMEEHGLFEIESGKLLSGYKITQNVTDKRKSQTPEFVSPDFLAEYENLKVVEYDERLVIVKKTTTKDTYVIDDTFSIEDFLVKISQQRYVREKAITDILFHKSFTDRQSIFIDWAFSLNDSKDPVIFNLSAETIIAVLKAKVNLSKDNLSIIENLFTKATKDENCYLFLALAQLYPDTLSRIVQKVVATLLNEGKYVFLTKKEIAELIQTKKDNLDDFHSMWLQVLDEKFQPDEIFIKKIAKLTPDQHKTLYQTAYICNNPYLHESPEDPVLPDQYSINLMWINESPTFYNQELLLEDKAFRQTLAFSVLNWVKKNPGSVITIWYDGKMASKKVIENSKKELSHLFENKQLPPEVQFNDVRLIPIVSNNEQVFAQKMNIFFRVDLLKTIIADYVLQNDKQQYFVYCDLDMPPISNPELFDKKTLEDLNTHGYVLAKTSRVSGFENGFMIANKNNKTFISNHKESIINPNLDFANNDEVGHLNEGIQHVYYSYANLFKLCGKSTKPVNIPPSHFYN